MSTKETNEKFYKKIETILKGVSNRRRNKILELLQREVELSVVEISDQLGCGYMNISDHIRKLYIANLVYKRSDGMSVRHKVTPLAKSILEFCKKLE